MSIPIWIDCDPGHDDALALLLAAYSPEIKILGISIVHGNDEVGHCALNAIRFLWACGVNLDEIPIYKGSETPIIREPKFCPEIHGIPGEEGVAGMCGYHFPDELIFKSSSSYNIQEGHGVLKLAETIKKYPEPVTIIATGAQTNIALAIRLFPELKSNIKQIIFMGGAIGIGNTGIAAEFNIEIDPEAAYIVLHSGIPLVMIPLEVTHTVLLTDNILECIKNIKNLRWDQLEQVIVSNSQNVSHQQQESIIQAPTADFNEIQARISNKNEKLQSVESNKANLGPLITTKTDSQLQWSKFGECCYQLLTFFKSTYFNVFSFKSPPIHDPTTIFYLISPKSFKTIDVFVDVELGYGKCIGRTLVDIHNISKCKPNVKVCTSINLEMFWKHMFQCLKIADEKSPLNENK